MQEITIGKEAEKLCAASDKGFVSALDVHGAALRTGECHGYNIIRAEMARCLIAHCVVTEEGNVLYALRFLMTYAGLRNTVLYNSIVADVMRGADPYAFCSLYPGHRMADTLYVTAASMERIVEKILRDMIVSRDSKYGTTAVAYVSQIRQTLDPKPVESEIVRLAAKRVKVPKGDTKVRESFNMCGNSVPSTDGKFSIATVKRYKAGGKYMRVYALQGPQANVSFVLSPDGTPLFRISNIMLGPVWTSLIVPSIWTIIRKSGNADANSVYSGQENRDHNKHHVKYASARAISSALADYVARTEVAKALQARARGIVDWLVEVSDNRGALDDVFVRMGVRGEARRCTNVGTRTKPQEPSQSEAPQAGNSDVFDNLAEQMPIVETETAKTRYGNGKLKPAAITDGFANDVVHTALAPKIEKLLKAIDEKKRELAVVAKKFESYKASVEKEIEALQVRLGQCYSLQALVGSILPK